MAARDGFSISFDGGSLKDLENNLQRQAAASATETVQRRWEDFCRQARGRTPDQIRRIEPYGPSVSDECVNALSRGENVQAEIEIRFQ